MKTIKVLGTGCGKCTTTARIIEEAIEDIGADMTVEKVEDIQTFMHYGVLATPAVVIDDEVVHSGGVPNRSQIEAWLRALKETP